MCHDRYRNKHMEHSFKVNWNKDFSDPLWAVPQSFIRRYEQAMYDIQNKNEDVCQKNLKKGFAVVKFQLAEQSITRVIKKLRYSNADYVSNLGKVKTIDSMFQF